VRDADLGPAWVREHLVPLLADPARVAAMAAAARTVGVPDGAARVADLVEVAGGAA
jgi:UDP-N-acetylglucosamine:LPS N-acetylglucosamine transferase